MSSDILNSTDQKTAMIQLLIFSVAQEEYALNLTETQEIVEVPEITPVPNMPPAIRGIANLHGTIVTVIDLEILFGIESDHAMQKFMIITEKNGELFGLLVNTADEVLRTTPDALRDTPDLLQAHPHADYLRGIVITHTSSTEQTESKERIILALNLETLLQEISALTSDDLSQHAPPEPSPAPTPSAS